MKQNLLVVSYDYELSKQIAIKLADVFSMRFFDQKELFEFDHMPMSFREIYSLNGADYVKKKMKSIIGMELDFDNAVFVADISFADNCFELFYKIKLSNFVIFLHKTPSVEMQELTAKKYASPEEYEFFCPSENQLKKRELSVANDCADVRIDITSLEEDEIVDKIVDKIKEYYSVN